MLKLASTGRRANEAALGEGNAMEKTSDALRIKLNGAYGIERAAELARELGDAVDAAKAKPGLILELDGLVELDLPAVQILYAAKRSCLRRGLGFEFAGAVDPELSNRLLAGGLVSRRVADGGALAEAFIGFSAIGA